MSQDSMTIMVMTHNGMRDYHLPYRLLQAFFLLSVTLLTTLFLIGIDYQEHKQNLAYYRAGNKHMLKAVSVLDQRYREDTVRLRTINLVLRRLHNYNESLLEMAGLPAASLIEEEEVMGLGGPVDLVVELEKPLEPIETVPTRPKELEEQVFSQEKSFVYLKSFLEQQSEQLSATPSIKPVVGNVFLSSHFGFRISPFSKTRKFHSGIDLSGRRGMPIIATADGVILKAGWQKGYGQLVEIDHGFGYVTRYGHNHEVLVAKGDKVKRGDEIALMGSTGFSTGPHSHYEVLLNKRSMNPMNYMLNW